MRTTIPGVHSKRRSLHITLQLTTLQTAEYICTILRLSLSGPQSQSQLSALLTGHTSTFDLHMPFSKHPELPSVITNFLPLAFQFLKSTLLTQQGLFCKPRPTPPTTRHQPSALCPPPSHLSSNTSPVPSLKLLSGARPLFLKVHLK